MERTDSLDSNASGYECCYNGSDGEGLHFDPSSLENIILNLCDNIDLRVVLGSDRAKGALLVTTGLALAGGMIGRHYGGNIGAAVGGAVGGACGIGIIAVSMRDIWEDVKSRLTELFEIVYDYLAGLGIDDYRKAALFLTRNSSDMTQLSMIIVQVVGDVLGKKVLSSITAG